MTALASVESAREARVRHADWVLSMGPEAAAGTADTKSWRSSGGALTVARIEHSDLRVAEDARRVVFFFGTLTNVAELEPRATQDDAARIVLGLLNSDGDRAFAKLRGAFGILSWDRQTGTIVVARDHIGIAPLFYARGSSGWLFSPSPDVLVRQPGVSAEPDAIALSEWVCGFFPAIGDTSYRAVKRVPPASIGTFDGAGPSFTRYWDPYATDETDWLSERDLDGFNPLLERAVARATQGQSAAVFLSGGVDSISVAVTATDLARRAGHDDPLALSLVFPDGESNEEPIQTGVARKLGVTQLLVPFQEAAGPRGLLQEALTMTATWPQPMWNIWTPAYNALARLAASQGRQTVLTGRGGDEWLTITPFVMADQVRSGDLLGAWKVIQMRRRSHNLSGMRDTATLLWTTVGRSLGSAALDAVTPRMWHRRRRERLLRLRPSWVAPRAEVRTVMDERIEQWMDPARPRGGFYARESRTSLYHPAVNQDMEETQEFGRRHGLRVLHPYWDVDLIDMLRRVPPDLLIHDGRSKSLVRRRLGERLPGLGLERRGKVNAGYVFQGIMKEQAHRAWDAMGGLVELNRIGVVDMAEIKSQRSEGRWSLSYGRLWTLLNFESWLRQRA